MAAVEARGRPSTVAMAPARTPMLIGECATALTERRTRDLNDQLACPGGDLSCER